MKQEYKLFIYPAFVFLIFKYFYWIKAKPHSIKKEILYASPPKMPAGYFLGARIRSSVTFLF